MYIYVCKSQTKAHANSAKVTQHLDIIKVTSSPYTIWCDGLVTFLVIVHTLYLNDEITFVRPCVMESQWKQFDSELHHATSLAAGH